LLASKVTWSGAPPVLGLGEKEAVGLLFDLQPFKLKIRMENKITKAKYFTDLFMWYLLDW
jgi:hypothetical protein